MTITKPIRISYVTNSLGAGGAESMLYRLISHMDREGFQMEVISLSENGRIGDLLKEIGVPTRALGMRPGLPNPVLIWRLARWLSDSQPDLVSTWLYHADLIGGLANRLGPRTPIVWNVRHANPDPRHTKRTTRWTAKACARLSRTMPERILFCSEASRRHHIDFGYDSGKSLVIPNGFDLDVFYPDEEAYRSLRRELGLAISTPLIGLAARWHRVKDHRTFIEAARLLHGMRPEVHFLLCGIRIDWDNTTLVDLIESKGMRESFHLLGIRRDIPRVTAAMDIATSSSIGEAFSNTIAEAMACAVPCTVTDVGDSAMMVGDTGIVIPPGQPEALCSAWQDLLGRSADERKELGASARHRIAKKFEIGVIAARHEAFYREVLDHARN